MANFKTLEAMIEAAKIAISNSSLESTILIGCDSLRRKRGAKYVAIYSVVVIVHIDSKHGAVMFAFTEEVTDYTGSMKMRLLTEVDYSRRAAEQLIDVASPRHIEIHLDLNTDPKHKSSVAVKEAVGYIRGMFGFDPILKPLAYAATTAADHIVRH